MLKAMMFAAALATAGAGVVYAQSTMGTERGAGGTMGGRSGSQTLGQRESTGGMAGPAVQIMTTLPTHATAVSNWYDRNVYDQQENKIGEIKDMLLDREGRVQAVIISVGGFLGMGEKDVAVAFDAVQPSQRENRWWLTMNATKDQLRTAPGFRFDRSKQAWTVAARD
ncbi:PRC-barrel domain-containing protein [Methylocystis parvus]|uniref:PRC-barrel domain containing protein n=1 Tax=Methylocystis parvus TaxID=134 RepID=A0A6B8M4U5_9HYPH|nr:PRC-barrel domain-containing protein [Methylocystis parvus]QGM98974.1 PRC-barrel domain containing protein [Methylocystis parvus]WBK00666.1 PRC-barrel domain-containing protein [Methylocystis parvus OBBP]